MNPFWMVAADLRRHMLAGLGTFFLLSAAFSINVAARIFERGLVDSGAAAAADFDLVIGAPGSRLDLVLTTVFLRTDETLPLLDYAVAEKLAADPRVAASSPFVLADNYRGVPIVGVGDRFAEIRPSLRVSTGAWPSGDFEAVVGAEVPLSVDEEFESGHGIGAGGEGGEDRHRDFRYRVVGVLSATGTPWDRAIVTPFRSLWKIHGHGDEGLAEAGHGADGAAAAHGTSDSDEERGVSAVLVKPVDFAAAYALRSEYRSAATTSAFPGEVLSSVFGLFADARGAVSVLALLLQCLVLAAVILSLLASLPSKYRWIGLLRSLGAPRLYIFLTLWIQSAIVFVLAGAFALLAGRLSAEALASAVRTGSGLRVRLSWDAADVYPLALFLLVAFAGALIPALVGFRVSVRKSILSR